MYGLLSSILQFLLVALRPPAGTPSRALRKAGAVTVAFGLSVLVLAAVVVALLQSRLEDPALAAKLAFPLWVIGFGSVVIGGFRAVLAAEPGEMSSEKRIALGVLFGCGTLIFLFGMLLAAAFAVAWLSS